MINVEISTVSGFFPTGIQNIGQTFPIIRVNCSKWSLSYKGIHYIIICAD